MTSSSAVANRPLAHPTPESVEFWLRTAHDELSLQRCQACHRFTFYPRVQCPACGSALLSWTTASGRGTVWSYSVVGRAVSEAFRASVPYVVALVALDEGPLMMSNIVDVDPADVSIGLAVTVCFEPIDDGRRLPLFRPAADVSAVAMVTDE
jgi:uncharacterized OB-fold protein